MWRLKFVMKAGVPDEKNIELIQNNSERALSSWAIYWASEGYGKLADRGKLKRMVPAHQASAFLTIGSIAYDDTILALARNFDKGGPNIRKLNEYYSSDSLVKLEEHYNNIDGVRNGHLAHSPFSGQNKDITGRQIVKALIFNCYLTGTINKNFRTNTRLEGQQFTRWSGKKHWYQSLGKAHRFWEAYERGLIELNPQV
jgi:hypothetical protein